MGRARNGFMPLTLQINLPPLLIGQLSLRFHVLLADWQKQSIYIAECVDTKKLLFFGRSNKRCLCQKFQCFHEGSTSIIVQVMDVRCFRCVYFSPLDRLVACPCFGHVALPSQYLQKRFM